MNLFCHVQPLFATTRAIFFPGRLSGLPGSAAQNRLASDEQTTEVVALTKIERVLAAIRGDKVDRPPFSFWYHFGLQHRPGKVHAEAEIDFYRFYQPDFLKVMSDYPYPLPDGLQVVTTEDWKRVEPVPATHQCWVEQLNALSALSDTLSQEALFIETIFSPWTTVRRMARAGGLKQAMQQCPEDLLSALNAIALSLGEYARAAVARGAAGIFFSLGAATADVMSAEEYRKWGRPFDLKVLEAVADAPFHVVHVHGERIHFEEAADLPGHAFNWSHTLTPPSLSEGKKRTGRTVMGGVNETTASRVSAPEVTAQVEACMKEAGTTGVMVTPGCSVPTDTPVRNLMAI